jgi:ABC-type transporter Mla subunit MlaD
VTDEQLEVLAADIEAIAERLADRAIELLRAAVADPESRAAASTEKLVTRARRSLEKAASLLRAVDQAPD